MYEDARLIIFMNVVSKYSRLKSSNMKASSNNKVTNYIIASRSIVINNECVGPHNTVRLITCEDGKCKFISL